MVEISPPSLNHRCLANGGTDRREELCAAQFAVIFQPISGSRAILGERFVVDRAVEYD
jgi:hypothetical protein